ncbi:hypothetical protein [Brevibacterium luteolum]|nr:hypothetical protein [Brevibacterium luteolum]MCT1872615.1 hypothetical protein [Brevibacterium luteolum]MCT1890588.1 hypothetical protein [Brevibacterium luteolum]MCT1893078.1 hypothetical protein [Brevibacterium luteolum]MCT1923870.1 hypothetical protein [Brevibacterium luteolum]
MTWKADPQAALNAARAMRRPAITDFLRKHAPSEWRIVPAVAADPLGDIVRQFDGDSGIIMFTRSKDVVDVLVLNAAEHGASAQSAAPLLTGTVGDLIAEFDQLDREFPAQPAAQRLTFDLAA